MNYVLSRDEFDLMNDLFDTIARHQKEDFMERDLFTKTIFTLQMARDAIESMAQDLDREHGWSLESAELYRDISSALGLVERP